MAARANWKGVLKIAEVTCPVALYTAVSTAERIAFHTLNRQTGHRLRREFIDPETDKPVAAEDQVKGYETAKGEYVVLEPDEIVAAIPDSDKTLDIQAFVTCGDIDDIYFDRPYYLTPGSAVAAEGFALLREGMRARKVAAIARTVLFRRMRTVLVRVHDDGFIATTLNFDYEVRSAEQAFADIPTIEIAGEMLDLAKHIIKTKRGKFVPGDFDDRYEAALADLVKAKLEGRKLTPPKPRKATKANDLMAALRESAGGKKEPARRKAS